MIDTINTTYEQIMVSKNKLEIQKVISKSLNDLKEHGVHSHIISRFLMKLQYKLVVSKNNSTDLKQRVLLDEAINLTKNVDFGKIFKR